MICIKQAGNIQSGIFRDMIYSVATSAIVLLTPLLLAPLALVAENADAVNERIPVSSAQLEEHWQVACAQAWEALQASGKSCRFSAELRRQIKLCGFIYQAPGGTSQSSCPDYLSASEHLQQTSLHGDCRGLVLFLREQDGCH